MLKVKIKTFSIARYSQLSHQVHKMSVWKLRVKLYGGGKIQHYQGFQIVSLCRRWNRNFDHLWHWDKCPETIENEITYPVCCKEKDKMIMTA